MTDSSLQDDAAGDGEPPARERLSVPAPDDVADQIRTVSFWTAAVLPLVYVPLLAYGLSDTTHVAVFVGLVAANVVALVVGRTYSAD